MRFADALVPTLALAALLACSGARAAEPSGAPDLREARDPVLQQGLERVVREQGLDGEVASGRLSLALVDVTQAPAPRLAMLNGDEMMYAASLPKIGILVGALVEAERGRLPLDEQTVGAMNNMIRNSSNEDATRVLDWVGADRLLEILQSERYRVLRRRRQGRAVGGQGLRHGCGLPARPDGNLSHGATAFQVARLYYVLAGNTLLSPWLNDLMKETLSNPGIHHKFVQGPGGPPGRAHLPQVRHLEEVPRRQRARRARRPPLRHGRSRRARGRRRLADAAGRAVARSRCRARAHCPAAR